jgi:hypothetical protein
MRFVSFSFAMVLSACSAPPEDSSERWLGGCGVDPDAVLRASATTDSDHDGINDALDRCPFDFGETCAAPQTIRR